MKAELIEGYKIDNETLEKIEYIDSIYNKYTPAPNEMELASKYTNEVLATLFKTQFSFLIPFDFIESELGAMLFEIKFIHQRYYSTQDISIILDQTTTNIYYNNKQGYINLQSKGGIFLVTEGELRRYMLTRGHSNEEIDIMLETFWGIKKDYLGTKVPKKKLKALYDQAVEERVKKTLGRRMRKRNSRIKSDGK